MGLGAGTPAHESGGLGSARVEGCPLLHSPLIFSAQKWLSPHGAGPEPCSRLRAQSLADLLMASSRWNLLQAGRGRASEALGPWICSQQPSGPAPSTCCGAASPETLRLSSEVSSAGSRGPKLWRVWPRQVFAEDLGYEVMRVAPGS